MVVERVREGKRVNGGEGVSLCSGSSDRSLPGLLIFYCERSEQPLPKGGTGQQTKPNFTQPDFGERRFVLLGRYLALILRSTQNLVYVYLCM